MPTATLLLHIVIDPCSRTPIYKYLSIIIVTKVMKFLFALGKLASCSVLQPVR